MKRRFTTLLLGSISVLALTAPVWAASDSIEEVVVTASKRPEMAKDIPMAISALGENQLSNLNARSFEDFVNQVPGLSLVEDSPTHPQLVLRGINSGGVGSTVGTYIDETPYGSSSALANGVDTAPNLDTFDMSRVEVLRGPQGTLYGSSTLGGLLKFVTNAPDPSGFAAALEAGATTVDGGSSGGFARGMVNVPITDTTALRLVGFDSHEGGWMDDPSRGVKNTNNLTSYGGRAEFLYQPNDNFSLRLNLLTQKIDAGDSSQEDVVVVGKTFHPLFGDYEHARTTNEPSSSLYRLYNLTINWNWKWAVLTSATSYATYDDRLLEDGTGVYGVNLNARLGTNKVTQELRLASEPDDGPLDWLVGGYYTHENAALVQNLQPIGFLQLNSRYIEKAGFANVTYRFTPRFDISLGGRYSNNDQVSDEFGLESAEGTSSESTFTWSGAVDYKLDDATSVYARVAKGYRPGGPNLLPLGATGVPASFQSDSLIDYEAGVKADLLDGKLSLDADVFYIDWSNIQLLTVINNTGVDTNGGSARSEGAEWNIQWQPLDSLILSWSGAYTDAKLTADTDPIVGGKSGDALPWSPKWTSTVNADYRFASIGAWTPYIGGSWRYVGRRYSDFQAAPSEQLPFDGYNGFDARIGIDWNQWEVEIYGKNLSNAKGVTEYSSSGISAASALAPNVSLIAPRLLGVVLRAKF